MSYFVLSHSCIVDLVYHKRIMAFSQDLALEDQLFDVEDMLASLELEQKIKPIHMKSGEIT